MHCGINSIGDSAHICEDVLLGFPSREKIWNLNFTGTKIGKHAVIRSGTVIYSDIVIGNYFQTGHNALIREYSVIGNYVNNGSSTIIDGKSHIGDHVNFQSKAYIPSNISIEAYLFIGPNAVLTNDPYPPHGGDHLRGPIINQGAAIGANATLLPGLEIGERSLVAAGTVVTKNVLADTFAVGVPT